MKRTGPKTKPWGNSQVRSEGEDFISFTVITWRGFYFIHSYCLHPILQVGTEEGQGKITNTKRAFKASQKNAMVDCVEGST